MLPGGCCRRVTLQVGAAWRLQGTGRQRHRSRSRCPLTGNEPLPDSSRTTAGEVQAGEDHRACAPACCAVSRTRAMMAFTESDCGACPAPGSSWKRAPGIDARCGGSIPPRRRRRRPGTHGAVHAVQVGRHVLQDRPPEHRPEAGRVRESTAHGERLALGRLPRASRSASTASVSTATVGGHVPGGDSPWPGRSAERTSKFAANRGRRAGKSPCVEPMPWSNSSGSPSPARS
jgi:hypothetical protein